MPELVAENIQKRLGQALVLRGVSFHLNQGEILALLGPSGSGKTTLLRSVAGLERPDAGRIELGGKVIFDAASQLEVPAERRGLGLVFQSYAIWPHRTVYENVAYGLRLRRASETEIQQRVGAVLEQLGLKEMAARYPHQLSGGQQQRVALARALVYSPPVLLLDEPLSNLDAKLREESRAWLRELIKQTESSALYVTHDQIEALAIADRILLLENGQIQQEGTPEQIYAQPANRFVAEFMGSNNRMEGKIAEISGDRARLEGNGWSLWATLRATKKRGDDAVALIHVERVRVVEAPGENHLGMSLRSASYLGERWEHLFIAGDLRLRVWASEPLPQKDYWVLLPPDKLWIF